MTNFIFVAFALLLSIGCSSSGSGPAASPPIGPPRSYFIDGSNPAALDSGPGTLAEPWHSLAGPAGHSFQAGDSLLFRCGSSYSGAFTLSASGSETNVIAIGSYGSGAAPVLSNPGQLSILTLGGSYVTVEGLAFTDAATMMTWNTHSYENSGAILILSGGQHIQVQNCEFTQVGVGVKSWGLFTSVVGNNFHDLVIAYNDSSQSYGAIGVSLNNSNARVSQNRFTNCRSTSSPYGADGGAVEIEGATFAKDNILIDRNLSSGSQGFLEVTETTSSNVTLAYNVSDDYQQFIAFDTTVTPNNYQALNNTVVRTRSANATNVFTIFQYRVAGPAPASAWLRIANNVFYTPACQVLRGTYTYKDFDFSHDHNVIFSGLADPMGYPLGGGDNIADPMFVSVVGKDYHLQGGSPALNAGIDVGLATDFNGTLLPMGVAPDCGAFQHP